MSGLEAKIRQSIKESGPMAFHDYMELALYDPEYGYYNSARTILGREGDFATSPHIHPIFGRMLARQVHEAYEALDSPEGFCVMECGAGQGYLALDVLDALRKHPLYDNITYYIVEKSHSLKSMQQELLSPHEGRVVWLDRISDARGIVGVVIANELVDAFAVHMVQMDKGSWAEVFVDVGEDGFMEVLNPASDEIRAYMAQLNIDAADGYRTEVNLEALNWIEAVSVVLKEGFVLTIDYGYPAWEYYAPERDRGTLMCYKDHKADEDVYASVGTKDITAHVNFSALKNWGEHNGLRTLGFARQSAYLVSLGIDQEIEAMMVASKDPKRELSMVKGLIMPGTIGDSHKVLLQYKGGSERLEGFSPKGFEMRNQLRSL